MIWKHHEKEDETININLFWSAGCTAKWIWTQNCIAVSCTSAWGISCFCILIASIFSEVVEVNGMSIHKAALLLVQKTQLKYL